MSTVIDIADAVVAELEDGLVSGSLVGGTFSMQFTPIRRMRPLYDLEKIGELRVTIAPRALAISAGTRALSQNDVQIDVAVQKRMDGDVDQDGPPLCDLVEEIADFLRQRPLTDVESAKWVRTVNDPAYAAEHLAEHKVFTSVLTLTYLVLR